MFPPHICQIAMFSLLNYRLSNRCEVVSHYNFNFSNYNDVEHLFMNSFSICISSLVKCLFKSFAGFVFLLSFKNF